MPEARPFEQQHEDYLDQMIEKHPPLDLGKYTYAIRDVDQTNARFGATLDHLAETELRVDLNMAQLQTVSHNNSSYEVKFEGHWGTQEKHHGLALDGFLRPLGRPEIVVDPEDIGVASAAVGLLTKHVKRFERPVRHAVNVIGAMTERAATQIYGELAKGLEEVDEQELLQLIKDIKVQEPPHNGHYTKVARNYWEQMPGWERWTSRQIRQRGNAFPGVYDRRTMGRVGGLLTELYPNGNYDKIATRLNDAFLDLYQFQKDGGRVPQYVFKGLKNCQEAYAAGDYVPAA